MHFASFLSKKRPILIQKISTWILFNSLFFLFSQNLVLANGIDWESSYMKVEFTKENENTPEFSCFGFNTRKLDTGACLDYSGPAEKCVWENLETLGFSEETPSPEISNCFHQAGNYKTTLQLFDFAQNPAEPHISNFVIFPETPDPDASIFFPSESCNDESLTANGEDICTILFKVRDKFGNPVTQLKNITGELYSDTNFINDANFGDLTFRDGLRLNNEIIPFSTDASYLDFTLSNDNEVQHQFTLKSWTPSTTQVGPYLGKNIPFTLDLNIKLPTINSDGSLNSTEFVTFAFDKYSPSVQFRPWIRTLLSFVNSPEFILNVPTPMKVIRNLLLPTNKGSNTLISLLVHHLPENMKITNTATDPDTITLNSQETNINPTLALKEIDDIVPDNIDLAFSTKAQYTVDDGTGNKIIKYPSGAVGRNIADGAGADDYDQMRIITTVLGASIEGILLGDKETTIIQDEKTVFLGSAQLKDTRQEIFQNTFEISRGIIPKTDINKIQFDPTWFDDEDVILVKDQDVIIGTEGSSIFLPVGKNSLIIQNGNLIIEGDFSYQNKLDSFGFILINDKVEEAPEKGNIFIRTNVKKFSGTYFAEGGVISNDSIMPNLLNHHNGEENNIQLLLEGTLLTHNTLGGSRLDAFEVDYLTPWKKTTNQSEAVIYDLHLVRQYQPTYDEFEPFAQNNTEACFSDPCDINQNSFVIRVDGRATKLPPPGFETSTILNR